MKHQEFVGNYVKISLRDKRFVYGKVKKVFVDKSCLVREPEEHYDTCIALENGDKFHMYFISRIEVISSARFHKIEREFLCRHKHTKIVCIDCGKDVTYVCVGRTASRRYKAICETKGMCHDRV